MRQSSRQQSTTQSEDRMRLVSTGSRRSSLDDTELKRNKTFKQILNSYPSPFDGMSTMEYRPWKVALHRDVDGLDLNANQRMDLLLQWTARTARKIYTALKSHPLIGYSRASVTKHMDSPRQTLSL